MFQLWENPKTIATILLNAEVKDIKENLAHFVVHNLYNDIKNDDQLIYIVTLILKKEINNLNNEGTCCGIILKEFHKKKDVKYFFKSIFFDIFKKLKTQYSSQNIILNIDKIYEEIYNENNDDNINTIIYDDKNKLNLIKNKYITQYINLETLNKISENCQIDEMKFLIDKMKTELSNYPEIYSNKDFLEKINFDGMNKDKIMNYYISSFMKIIDLLDIFFTNLIKNIDMLPYSIKCLCKIISILINKNFSTETCLDKLAYFNIFFFDVLLINIIDDPSNNTFTNEFLIEEKTKNILQILQEILHKIFYGKLFQKIDFIPFNYYIIEKFNDVINFQKMIDNVKLPYYIEQLINNEEFSEKYEYDYFKENPDEVILYRNLCFNINELYSLLSIVEKIKDKININKKILSKFKIKENQKKLEQLKSKEEIDINSQDTSSLNFSQPTTIINCFLLIDVITNKKGKIKNIINYENSSKNYFSIDEINENNINENTNDKANKHENNIIKIKNLLCGLFYNFEPLSKNIFFQSNITDMDTILKTIKKFSEIISNISLSNNNIPFNWYIDSIFQILEKIKIPLDFHKIINELEEDISTSIKNIPFEDLYIYIEYHNKIKTKKIYYEKVKNILKDINLNIKVENIIRKEFFIIDLNINFNELKDNEKKNYEIISSIINKKDKYFRLFMSEEYNIYYNTIQHFINNFPNSIEIFQNSDIGNCKLINDENIPDILNSYFYFIKKNLFSKGIVNELNINDIFNKIFDYIFENLHYKLFPQEQLIIDTKIFKNCYKHQWLKPKYLFKKEKNFVSDNFLIESINYFRKFEQEKSPRKKIENVKKIFELLYKVGNFNNDKVELVDDELALLTLIIVKFCPLNLYANCKYCELFYAKKGFESNVLTKFLSLCEKFKNDLSEKDFYNITKEEYELNCQTIFN